jgi:uncharacterized protein YceK
MKNLYILLTTILFVTGCSNIRNINKESQFSVEQSHLIMSADSTTPMRVLSIFNKKD